MFKLRLIALVARVLGIELTYNARFFDEKSQSRGRTVWTTDDVGEAIDWFENDFRLTREKTYGTNHLTIEAQVASREWDGRTVNNIADQLTLKLRQSVQDAAEKGPDGARAQETEAAEAPRADGGGADAGYPAGTEASAGPGEPVEVKKIDLTNLGVR